MFYYSEYINGKSHMLLLAPHPQMTVLLNHSALSQTEPFEQKTAKAATL